MARSVFRGGGVEDKTTLDLLDLWGLISRSKFHRQYRRNGTAATGIKANTYGTIDQFSLKPSLRSCAKGPEEVLENT
jgi:hypothetical protein